MSVQTENCNVKTEYVNSSGWKDSKHKFKTTAVSLLAVQSTDILTNIKHHQHTQCITD